MIYDEGPGGDFAPGEGFTFRAFGTPMPQGSKTIGKRKDGSLYLREGKGTGTQRHRAWRHNVSTTALVAVRQSSWSLLKHSPVKVRALFFLPCPASRSSMEVHVQKPDLDKLLRTVLDALAGVAYEDDKQVAWANVCKAYADQRDPTGVHVMVTRMQDTQQR